MTEEGEAHSGLAADPAKSFVEDLARAGDGGFAGEAAGLTQGTRDDLRGAMPHGSDDGLF